MSESKEYYEAGKSLADEFKDGLGRYGHMTLDEWDKTDSSQVYKAAKSAMSRRAVEYRDSENGRNIGVLAYITHEDWDRLGECVRVSGLSMDEVVSRAIRQYHFAKTFYRYLEECDPDEDSM